MVPSKYDVVLCLKRADDGYHNLKMVLDFSRVVPSARVRSTVTRHLAVVPGCLEMNEEVQAC